MAGECDKHIDCMERIHESINQIKLTNAKMQGSMEAFTQELGKFYVDMREDIYSPDGIIPKISNHSFQLAIQWGIIGVVILGGIVGLVVSKLLK